MDEQQEREALDRNWNELLQELRVTQTGLQILTGFLATLPFQQRFSTLSTGQHRFYLVVMSVAIVATIVVLAPASFHRLLFRQQEKEFLVRAGNNCARGALALSAVAVSGVAALLFSVVVGVTAGVVAGIVFAVGFVSVWVGVPLLLRPRSTLARTPRHSPRS